MPNTAVFRGSMPYNFAAFTRIPRCAVKFRVLRIIAGPNYDSCSWLCCFYTGRFYAYKYDTMHSTNFTCSRGHICGHTLTLCQRMTSGSSLFSSMQNRQQLSHPVLRPPNGPNARPQVN